MPDAGSATSNRGRTQISAELGSGGTPAVGDGQERDRLDLVDREGLARERHRDLASAVGADRARLFEEENRAATNFNAIAFYETDTIP